MAHETLSVDITREWALVQAKNEPEIGVTSVGGLAHSMNELARLDISVPPSHAEPIPAASPRRFSLGKFVELSRRRLRLSVEQLADQANVDLSELVAIESAENLIPEPKTIYELAKVLQVRAEPLLELAGLRVPTTSNLVNSAVRFAARYAPTRTLSTEEEAALDWFVEELTKA